MSIAKFRTGSAAAIAACLSMVASPVLAAPSTLTIGHSRPVTTLPGDVAYDHGHWGGGWGGGRGWGGHHHDGIDGGDVLAGLLVIGAIAAVASAASSAAKEKSNSEDYRDEPPPPARYGDDRGTKGGSDWGRSRSIDEAVDTCVGEVERGTARVDSVDSIGRDGSGWQVSGRTRSGDPFSCSVDGEGHVRTLTVNGRAPFAS